MTDESELPDPSLDSAFDSFFASIEEQGIEGGVEQLPSSHLVSSGSTSSTLVGRLPHLPEENDRYQIIEEVGRGGMGAVIKIWDDHLRRKLAMKVILSTNAERKPGSAPLHEEVRLSRFLEEAQVTGQLDHPGVVPVHELGVDDSGKVYFTMRLVKGADLREIIRRVHDESDEEWTLTRALGVVLKVCETMAYAHEKDVIHRDLKPSNVMVGEFGEVYVMDWGLARAMGEEDPRDLRIAPAEDRATSEIRTERREEAATDTNSPVLTVDGAVIGTPYYMPPEQALGQIELIDTRSDVYTVGAILYHLITGRIPYSKPGARMSPYTVLAMVAQAPPQAVHELAPDVPAELEAICNKAMARESQDRYADMSELQSDIQAYFDGRVVRAYETGAIAELRKWVKRNRALASAIVASVLLAIVGLAATATVKARGEAREQLVADVLLLEELRDVPLALTCEPSNAGEFEHWQTIAAELSQRESEHRASLARLKHAMESAATAGEQVRFANKHERQEEFLASFASYFEGAGFEILNRRANYSREVEERTVSGTEAQAAWAKANQAIAGSPRYGFEIEPVLGVLPLGEDPTTGLWDFWLVESGDRPERNSNGDWTVTETMGIVLVLLPGGEFLSGGQNEDPNAPNFDADFDPDFDTPLHLATISPRLVSRFEMTQGQWLHSVGENPALNHDKPKRPLTHPIEGPTWHEYKRVLDGLRLRFPTIDEWEHAARAGTASTYFTGDAVASLEGYANLPDQTAIAAGKPFDKQTSVSWSDGHSGHAPVGSFRPNAFGLFDVHGNVAEWCGDPLLRPDEGVRYPLRGGAFDLQPGRARIASGLTSYSPTTSFHDLGVRPVMDVKLVK